MATKNPAAATQTQNVAPVRSAKTGATASGIRFTKTKSVTVPVLKLMPDAPAYVRAETAMHVSKQIKQAKVGDKPMEPATILNVTDLNTDSEHVLIVGKVLEGVINDTYPGQTYVGKCFEIINHGKRGDKKYNSYSVTEIALED